MVQAVHVSTTTASKPDAERITRDGPICLILKR